MAAAASGPGREGGARHEQDEIAADLLGRRHGMEGGRLQTGIVMLGDQQERHQITLASLRSLSTSSATLFTLTPAWRFGGSPTLSVFRRGLGSTPSCSGVSTSM